MKILKNLSLALSILTMSFVTPSLAETYSVSVAAGRKTSLRAFSVFNYVTCQYGPKASVQFQQPKNGTLSVQWGVVDFTGKGVCKKSNIKGYIVSYTPKGGFRGKDTGKVFLSYQKYQTSGTDTMTMKFDLTVK